jgi:hypothetical protein
MQSTQDCVLESIDLCKYKPTPGDTGPFMRASSRCSLPHQALQDLGHLTIQRRRTGLHA